MMSAKNPFYTNYDNIHTIPNQNNNNNDNNNDTIDFSHFQQDLIPNNQHINLLHHDGNGNTNDATDDFFGATQPNVDTPWLDSLETMITPASMSTTSSTSLESPLSFPEPQTGLFNMINNNINIAATTNTSNINNNETIQPANTNINDARNYVSFSNPNPISINKGATTTSSTPLYPMLKFENSTKETIKNNIKVKLENPNDQIPSSSSANNISNIKSKRRRSTASRKRLTPYQKEAHNKIEKRYRININTKIAKLQQIIPWVADEDTAFEVSHTLRRPGNGTTQQQPTTNGALNNDDVSTTSSTTSSSSIPSTNKLNKSMILEKAVDYILFLQNNENLYELEVQRLRNEVDSLKATLLTHNNNENNHSTIQH